MHGFELDALCPVADVHLEALVRVYGGEIRACGASGDELVRDVGSDITKLPALAVDMPGK